MARIEMFLTEGWSGQVERNILPLDSAEDCSAGLLRLGYDLQQFDLEY